MRDLRQRYRVLREVPGRRAAAVFQAEDRVLRRTVAVKFVAVDHALASELRDEARRHQALRHPDVVDVTDRFSGVVGFDDKVVTGFATAWAEGEDLVTWARRSRDGERLPVLLQLARTLRWLHARRWMHLDLKPANVMIDEHGEPLIGDFGLARQMDDTGSVTAQEVSGTPAFMAPEQVQIKEFRLTARTDLYALGAILFRLLTGESPHGRGGAQSLMQNAVAGRLQRISSFNPCDKSNKILDYYNTTPYAAFKEGNFELKQVVQKNLNTELLNKESGYLVFRFVINCEGEAGWFTTEEYDLDFQPKQFNKSLRSHLLDVLIGTGPWQPGILNGNSRDAYAYISFKLKNGEIIEILP